MIKTFGSLDYSLNRNLGLFRLNLRGKVLNFLGICLLLEKRVEKGTKLLINFCKRHCLINSSELSFN